MKAKTSYSLILAISLIIFHLILYLAGFETDKVGSILGTLLSYLSVPITFVVLWIGLKADREERPNQAVTYGQAFVTGLMITLVSTLIYIVFLLVHYTFINPSFAEITLEYTRQQFEMKGMPDQQIEAMLKITKFMLHPAAIAGLTLFSRIFCGTICSLIVAAFVKREAPRGFTPPSPPPLAQ